MTSTHHSFDTSLAREYGVHEAILIHHFQHWIKINIRNDKRKKNDKHYKDDRHWTYQTIESISDHFEYLSIKQIRRIVDKLESLNIIIKENYNDKPYDRTIWYAFNDEKMFLQIADNKEDKNAPHRELPKRANGFVQTGEPIPDTIPDTNIDNTNVLSCETSEKLSNHLYKSIISWKGSIQNNSSIKSWAKDIEKMIRIDGRNSEEIITIIDFITNGATKDSEFWRPNILSGAKLRKHYDHIDGKMKSSGKYNKSSRHKIKSEEDHGRYAHIEPEVYS
jgi:hypothetical protein